jgi:hypothetical protein
MNASTLKRIANYTDEEKLDFAAELEAIAQEIRAEVRSRFNWTPPPDAALN